jgi:hypothetical protein
MAIAVSATIAVAGMLSAIALAYTNGLNAEPGCRNAFVARLNGDSV